MSKIKLSSYAQFKELKMYLITISNYKKRLGFIIGLILFVTNAYSNDNLSSEKIECKNGNGETCFNIARLIERKIKNDKESRNFYEAIKFYKYSCDYGYGEACFNLANKFISGEGVHKNISQAIYLYDKAFKLDYPIAYVELGRMYSNGKVFQKDLRKAKNYYQKACDAGEKHTACVMLDYVDKVKSKKEDYRILEDMKKECTKNSMVGLLVCSTIGSMYKKYDDFENAIKYYKKACKVFSSECIPLGEIYINKKFKNYDENKAISSFMKACNDGKAEGCIKLGDTYKKVKKDIAKSNIYFRKACSLGYVDYCN